MIKNKAYKIGIIVLLITVSLTIGFLPGLIYFFFAPVIILIITIVLLWLTNFRIVNKLLFTTLPIVVIPLCILIWKNINSVEPETFLIPENYRGRVRIIFNQKCGESVKYEDKRRAYEIPNDGILLTQFKDEQGFINQNFYLLENGKRTKIEELMVQDFNEEWTTERNPKEPPRNKLAIFNAGRTYSDGSSEFYICTYNELKKYDFKYDKKFDSDNSKGKSSKKTL